MKKRRTAGNGSEERLLNYARSYLRDAFPNPQREGCPADTALVEYASHPQSGDRGIADHIACCSPCLNRYFELLADKRGPQEASARRFWTARRAIWTAAIILVAAITGYILISTRTGTTSTPISVFIDLSAYAPSRAPLEPNQTQVPVQLSRRPTNFAFELPLGSEAGQYTVAMESNGKAAWSQNATTTPSDHRVILKTSSDLRHVSAGRYTLRIAGPQGLEISVPAVLRNVTGKGKWPWNLTGAVFDSAILGRNWLASHRVMKATLSSRDPKQLLAAADHYAWLGNWAAAANSRAEEWQNGPNSGKSRREPDSHATRSFGSETPFRGRGKPDQHAR
jgi:hypothetical protein